MKKILRILVLAVPVGLAWAFLRFHGLDDIFDDMYLRSALAKDRDFLEPKMGRERSQRVIEGVKKHWEEFQELWPTSERGAIRHHRRRAFHTLALYRALPEELRADEDPFEIIEELVWQTFGNIHVKALAYILRKSRDPFRIFAWAAPLFTKYTHPRPPYEWEFVKGDGVVGIDFKNCPPYCDFYKQVGAPELTRPTVCEFDWRMMALFPPQIEMKRELCLSEGDDICEVRWYRR